MAFTARRVARSLGGERALGILIFTNLFMQITGAAALGSAAFLARSVPSQCSSLSGSRTPSRLEIQIPVPLLEHQTPEPNTLGPSALVRW